MNILDYLQIMGKCEKWVMVWYYNNPEEMLNKDKSLYNYANYIHNKYFK